MSKEAPIFYKADLSVASKQILEGDEAHHAIKVMRMSIGDKLVLVDGQGSSAYAEIQRISKKELELQLIANQVLHASLSPFHLAIAPTKQMERLEWCLEKCTEIGLASVTPVICQNSERRKLRLDRLEKVMKSAMKQSRSAYKPILNEAMPLPEFLGNRTTDIPLFIAHCRDGRKEDLRFQSGEAELLIGPEGDFSREEIQLAIEHGAMPVHLGEKRLRTETAAMVACTLMNP